jgi:hypothetical protein
MILLPARRRTTMIVIEPTGGLCNRLRALDSAIAFSINNNLKLNVLWILNSDCNCKFSDLFIVPTEFNRLTELKSGTLTRILKKFLKIQFSCFPNYYLDHKSIKNLKRQSGSAFRGIKDILDKLHNYNSVYIQSSNRFYYTSSYPPFSSFIPRNSIQTIINHYKEENMIGVHIRHTDNKKSIVYSPLEKFIDYMKKEIVDDIDVKFFVATDDPQSEIILKEIFSNRIVTHSKKSLDRNDPLAIQDAVIDLYCLANCRKLIGSYWSSFSETASEISGIDKVIIGKENPDTAA